MNVSRCVNVIIHPLRTYRELRSPARSGPPPQPAWEGLAAPATVNPLANAVPKADPGYFRKFMGILANNRIKIALSVLLTDQISKYYVRHNLPFNKDNYLIDNILCISPTFNYGGGLGTTAEQNTMLASQLATISLATILYGVLSLKKYSSEVHKLAKLGLVLFMGAHLGNGLERIINSRVTDFLVVFPKAWPYVFNVADMGFVSSLLVGGYAFFTYLSDKALARSQKGI